MTNALCSLDRGEKQSTRMRKSITRGIELGENDPVGKRASCGRRALVQAQAHFGRGALAAMPQPLHRWSLLLLPYGLKNEDLA